MKSYKNKSSSYLSFIDNIFMAWTKSENKLKSFINEINKKHDSIKFGFIFSKENIKFFDTLIYKDYINQNYLHVKSAHPFSLKKSIPYSQALRIKDVCATFEEYKKHSNDLVKDLLKKGTNKNHLKPN